MLSNLFVTVNLELCNPQTLHSELQELFLEHFIIFFSLFLFRRSVLTSLCMVYMYFFLF